jgi:hypothetical protein
VYQCQAIQSCFWMPIICLDRPQCISILRFFPIAPIHNQGQEAQHPRFNALI